MCHSSRDHLIKKSIRELFLHVFIKHINWTLCMYLVVVPMVCYVPGNYSLPWIFVFFLTVYLEIISNLEKIYKDSTKSSHIPFTKFPKY